MNADSREKQMKSNYTVVRNIFWLYITGPNCVGGDVNMPCFTWTCRRLVLNSGGNSYTTAGK